MTTFAPFVSFAEQLLAFGSEPLQHDLPASPSLATASGPAQRGSRVTSL
ncbi:hypothetical protein [Streptomyces sp. NPDC086023]